MPLFRRLLSYATTALVAIGCAHPAPDRLAAPSGYFPPPGEQWDRKQPAQLELDSLALGKAVKFAQASEIPWSMDMKAQLATNTAKEAYPDILGPYKDRGHQNGLIIRHGYIAAEWGDTRRVDMSFSVAKSYLSSVAGLAFDRGMLGGLDDPIGRRVRDGGFASAHNAAITWRMHLTQTSEWEGDLWGKPDRADRRAGYDRTLQPPGTFWEYNDVRVNRLALSVLRIWDRPLPEVLKAEIMDPIGASNTWEWHGYRTSMTEQNGRPVESVSGGGHWGGGVWASTRDHARFGYLMLRRGKWKDRQILSDRWVTLATTPTPIRPVYGFMWWLNTDRKQYPAATARSFFALGAGGNVIWMVPEYDMVVVVRWMDTARINEFMGLVLASVRESKT